MTALDLDKLEVIARAATGGEWRMAGTKDRPCPVVSATGPEGYQIHSMLHVKARDPDVWRHMQPIYVRDAAHIAAFDPPTALALIAAARARVVTTRYNPSYERLKKVVDAVKLYDMHGIHGSQAQIDEAWRLVQVALAALGGTDG